MRLIDECREFTDEAKERGRSASADTKHSRKGLLLSGSDKKKRETGWNRAYIRFYLIHQATEMEHNSRPTERMVSNIASIRSAEGFLVPLTYWANRLCDIPNLRAMAEALSSGCAINTSYKGLVGFFMKNPSKLRSSSISSQWIPSSLSVKLFRCSGVANFSLGYSANCSQASLPSVVRIHTAVSVSQTFSTTMFPIALSFNLVTKFIPMFRYYFLVFAHMF